MYSSGTVQSGHQSQPLPKYQLLDKHGDGRQSHRARGVVISDYSTPRPMAPRAAAPRETTRATETDLRKTSKKRRARARARPARARDPTDARRRPNASRPPPPQAVVIGVVAALAIGTFGLLPVDPATGKSHPYGPIVVGLVAALVWFHHFVDHTANEIAKAQQHSQELWCGQDSATRPTAMDKLATVRAALYINCLTKNAVWRPRNTARALVTVFFFSASTRRG